MLKLINDLILSSVILIVSYSVEIDCMREALALLALFFVFLKYLAEPSREIPFKILNFNSADMSSLRNFSS